MLISPGPSPTTTTTTTATTINAQRTPHMPSSPTPTALLEASKSAAGRQELLSSGQLAELAQQAAAALPKLDEASAGVDNHHQLLLLRLLRNSCALGAPAATLLLPHQLPQVVSDAAARIAAPRGEHQQRHEEQQQLLLPAVQLLHNLSATGPEGAAAVWAALFPASLDGILQSDLGAVHDAVALTCLSCARSHTDQALADLSSPAAATAWQRLLAPLMPQAGQDAAAEQSQQPPPTAALPHGNDNLCLLVKLVAMQHNKLQQLMQLLSPQQEQQQQESLQAALHAVEQHAVLLHVVALEAGAVLAGSSVPGLSLAVDAGRSSSAAGDDSSSSSWLQYVVQLLQELWGQASAAAAPTPGVCSNPTAVAHTLEAVLQVLTAVLARDQDAAAGVKPGKDTEAAAAAGLAATAQHLYSLGLLQQLLQMLTALGPPPKTKQQQQRELEEQQQRQQQGQSQQAQQGTAQPPPAQHQQPYAGYRADVLAVLSNLLLGGREVQDALMGSGGIELLLNNTNLDESSPMAREWALWGIRNACKDNAGVQGYVAQFQAVNAVQSPELDKMGMQLELDQMTHKLKLSKKQQDTL